jgi:tetratricopeptide (TPR) repeat protein
VYAWSGAARSGSEGGGAQSTPDALAAELSRLGVSDAEFARFLEPTDAIESWAKSIAKSSAEGLPRAQALVAALRARAEAEAFVPWSLADVRREPGPLTPSDTLEALASDRARKKLYPLEVAALVLTALRSLDEPAVLVEVFSFPEQTRPLDPSGRLGYYAIGLRDQAGAVEHVVDPYGAHHDQAQQAPRQSDFTVLSDREALGAALALRAAHVQAKDPVKALKDADAAVALSPRSPTTRSARAIALLGNAGSEEAIRELQAAAQLRSDPARRHNLAVVHLATGDIESAARELDAALESSPEFASARVTRAGLLLAQRDVEGARKELAEAERIDASLAALPLVWAQYYLGLGETAQAIVHAERGVERDPEDPQPRILLARLYRVADQLEPMREQARRVVALVPPDQRDRVRNVLLQMLGPDAFGAVAPADPAAVDPAGMEPSGGGLQLGGPLEPAPRLRLGGPRKGPSLLGESSGTESGTPPASGTLRGPGATPRLQLQSP